MAPCTGCDLSLSWREAQVHAAADIRHHCHFLSQERLITQVDEDTFAVTRCASA